MKKILILIAILFSTSAFCQQVVVLYMNTEWNHRNDYKHLRSLKNAKILEVDYDAQPKKLKQNIKSVPAIVLFDKNKKLKRVWHGGLSMKLDVDPKEIQEAINKLLN